MYDVNVMTQPTFAEQEDRIRQGGGKKAIERQHAKGRLTARERIARLLDPGAELFELGLWAAWDMYADWGSAPSRALTIASLRLATARARSAASCSSPRAPERQRFSLLDRATSNWRKAAGARR